MISRPIYPPTSFPSPTGRSASRPNLFLAGIRPAVNAGLSVSRVGGNAQIKAMKRVAGHLRLDLAQYRELEAFAQFGADLDRSTHARLNRGERIVELLKQEQYKPIQVADQVVLIYAVTNGFFDEVPTREIKEIEADLLRFIDTDAPLGPSQDPGDRSDGR